jgi:hypothetical protein
MAKVDKKTGRVTVQKGDTPKSIAKAVSAATGRKVTAAQINQAISANKTLAARQKAGSTVLFSGTSFKIPGVTTTTTSTPSGNAPIAKTITNRVTNDNGSITIFYNDGTSETIGGATLPDSADTMREESRRSAFALLEKEFTDNGLITLIPEIKRFMKEGYGAEEASLLLPTTEAYKTRFAGNEGRKTLGLPVYTPGQYITAEQTYRDLFNQYNLGELANQETYNSLIGGAVSIDEAKARVDNVFSRIDKASDELKTQLSNYLGAYGVGDPTKQRSQIALALMKGPQGINELETSLRKANIRTGAATSNINVAEENISQLEKQLSTSGLSTEQIGNLSREAYANIAEVQPTVTKLSEIYGEQTPGLTRELEQEAFFGLASQRRKKLQEREKATFGGQAGISTASLAQRTAGAI